MKATTSSYYRYHSSYLGYDFQNLLTGKMLTKGEFWEDFNSTARVLPTNIDKDAKPITPSGFKLVERPKQV